MKIKAIGDKYNVQVSILYSFPPDRTIIWFYISASYILFSGRNVLECNKKILAMFSMVELVKYLLSPGK